MDILLGKVTQQAMNYAIRSGVTLTTTYAISSCRRLLRETPKGSQREELMRLQLRLESKIRIISPAIDMIELVAARGNTSLESAVSVTKEIRLEIQALGTRLNNAANDEELSRRKSSRAKPSEETERELRGIIGDIKQLLERIEDAVPLINLAITTSGVNLSTKLSGNISPSRLLQASTFLTAADGNFAASPQGREQVGPTYIVSLYMLFAGHARPLDEAGMRETTWKEVIHKARLKLLRVPLDDVYSLPGEHSQQNGTANPLRSDLKSTEFSYQLSVVEDFDDDRVHTVEDDQPQPGPFDGVPNAGIRDVIPVHEVSKIFYADTGKILNIGGDDEPNDPVLLLKRDVHAEPPRRMLQRSQSSYPTYFDDQSSGPSADNGNPLDGHSELEAQIERESTPGTPFEELDTAVDSTAWRLPQDLDPEWMAFEVYIEEPDSSDDEDLTHETVTTTRRTTHRSSSLDPSMLSALSALNLRNNSTSSTASSPKPAPNPSQLTHIPQPKLPTPAPIKTSLSLLETLLKLCALQQFRQESHLSIGDELLNFFLEDSATAGAGPDKDYRQRLRHDAVRRVGFDPYDESPIKRRGEEYLSHARGAASPRPGSLTPEAFARDLPYDADYGYDGDGSSPVRPSIERPDYLPSSPSPQRGLFQQTPSRASTPADSSSRPTAASSTTPAAGATPSTAPTPTSGDRSSERLAHREAVRQKYAPQARARASSQVSVGSGSGSGIQTPPSTAGVGTRSRQGFLRTLSEPKVRSPLGREVLNRGRGLGEGIEEEEAGI